MNCLYISYTGLMEPLGQSQVYPYLRGLSDEHQIHLLSFERSRHLEDTERFEQAQQKIRRADLEWTPLRYHNRPSLPGTAWDLIQGYGHGSRILKENDIDAIHGRGHIPTFLAMALAQRHDQDLVFDMRGFWADARVDGGHWSTRSPVYRAVKHLEERSLGTASNVVVLSHEARDVLVDRWGLDPSRVHVIPTCVDLDLFEPRPDLDPDAPTTMGYVGSATGKYGFEHVARAFSILKEREPEARFSILNEGSHDRIRTILRDHAIPLEDVHLRALPHDEVPDAIGRMDIATYFLPSTFSAKANSPTKLGEFLAMGCPCLTNRGIGDIEAIVGNNDVGVLVDEPTTAQLKQGIDRILKLKDDPELPQRCRRVAEEWFSLTKGVNAYNQVYREIEP